MRIRSCSLDCTVLYHLRNHLRASPTFYRMNKTQSAYSYSLGWLAAGKDLHKQNQSKLEGEE